MSANLSCNSPLALNRRVVVAILGGRLGGGYSQGQKRNPTRRHGYTTWNAGDSLNKLNFTRQSRDFPDRRPRVTYIQDVPPRWRRVGFKRHETRTGDADEKLMEQMQCKLKTVSIRSRMKHDWFEDRFRENSIRCRARRQGCKPTGYQARYALACMEGNPPWPCPA
jgi:hypothetical protein